MNAEAVITSLVARAARTREQDIDRSRWLPEIGVDSLGQLVVRESVEKAFGLTIPDGAWLRFRCVAELVAFVESRVATVPAPAPVPMPAPATAPHLSASGLYRDEFEIGMPMTGRNNLAEGPLLQLLGDVRWRHISATCRVPSREIADAEGNRLYSTFFYVELAFPAARPMAAFGENDRLTVVSTMHKYGDSMIDGTVFLLPHGTPVPADAPPFEDLDAAVAAGVPTARLSNIFVRQFNGAEWLKKARPANAGFERIREAAAPPDSYVFARQAEQEGCFVRPGPEHVALTDGPVTTEYRLVPDRDLNGAGLVYFANYPVFLDICEREVLASAALPLDDDLIDRRTLVRRRSAYLNNASAHDVLSVEIEPFLLDPAVAGHPAPDVAPVRLFVNCRMRRQSDGRTMMVSSAEKVVFGRAMEDVGFFGRVASARHAAPRPGLARP